MARALIVAGAALLLAGCFHARSYSSDRAVATWRAMQTRKSAVATSAERPGDPPPGTTDSLSAEQTYALALGNNPDLAVLAARAEVAAAEVAAAKQLDNPQLRLTNFSMEDAIAGAPGVNVGMRVPIPRPGTIRARVQGAERAADAQQSLTDDARRQLRARIYKLFARMAKLNLELEHVHQAAALRASRRDQVSARVQQSVATRLDAALAEVAHAEAVDETARLRDELAAVQAELEQLAGAATPLRFHVDPGELQLRDRALDLDALTEQAIAARPELRTAQDGVGRAEADVYLARSKAWPWFDWAQLQYRAGPGSTAASFGFGVALTLPIFSLNRGEVRAKKAVLRQRELEERARIAAIAREVGGALTRVEQTARRVRELEQGLLPQLDVAAQEADAALAAGSLDLVAANEIAVRVVSARRLHTAALLAHREALIDLEAAIGGPLPGDRRPAGATP